MNTGRFPGDLLAILSFPVIMILCGFWLTPLMIPQHVHHRVTVITTVAVAALAIVIVLLRAWRRRLVRREAHLKNDPQRHTSEQPR
jgi:hypothetical protein